jgi:ADP-L-glycero-D-manno-heptose 6-epimerase
MILITGGAGFIGSNVLARLQVYDEPIAVCDVLGSGDKWRNLANHRLHDWIAPDDILPWLAGNDVECVVHMGAISSTTETDADKIVQNNFALSKMLWDWCTQSHVRFLYASSAATYGSGEQGFLDAADSASLASLKPLNAYGWSKHAFDRFVAWQVEHGEPTPPQWAGLKFFNVYGPNEYHKGAQASVIARQYEAIARGETIKLFQSEHPSYPDGGQLRDFVAVRDCVDILAWLFENPKKSGLFNVGTGTARTFKDLGEIIFRALGKEPRLEYVPLPEALRGKYQYFTKAPMDKLRQAGYKAPMTSLEDGVTYYVQEFLAAASPYL